MTIHVLGEAVVDKDIGDRCGSRQHVWDARQTKMGPGVIVDYESLLGKDEFFYPEGFCERRVQLENHLRPRSRV